METLRRMPEAHGGGTPSSVSSSPEFEFWMVGNPSFPPPNLLSADELFADGVLLPLPHHRPPPDEPPGTDPRPSDPDHPAGPHISAPSPPDAPSSSKRWRDIFKKGDKKAGAEEKEKEKEKKRGKSGGPTSAELNINLWPFSRSRSAGTGGVRPRMAAAAAGARKVSSAPCSRSNSAGESKSRKWPGSPSRAGVHLGRASPVWHPRRGGGGKRSDPPARNPTATKAATKDSPAGGGGGPAGPKARVLNLNVPMCIGYRRHTSCSRGGDNGAVGSAGGGGRNRGQIGGGGGGRGGNFLGLRGLFTKKVY